MENGTKILKVSASDLDAGNNAQITYKLISAPQFEKDLEYFEIQSESGWIGLKKSLGVSFHIFFHSVCPTYEKY